MKGISLALIVLVISVQSTRFDISSNAKCAKQQNGHCVQWNQVGQVVQQVAACFPEDTFILSKERGFIHMKELKTGEHILSHPEKCQGLDCSHYFTEVRGWLHRDTKTEFNEYLKISSNRSEFYVSPQHNIGVFQKSAESFFQPVEYEFAQDINGRKLYSYGGIPQTVTDISKTTKKGLYAPLTESNNYYIFQVNPTGKVIINEKVLAHCYAQIRNPTLYEPIIDVAIAFYETSYGKPSEELIIHPVAKWFAGNFKFLLEGGFVQEE